MPGGGGLPEILNHTDVSIRLEMKLFDSDTLCTKH